MTTLISRFLAGRSGSTAVIGAIFATIFVSVCAVVADVGSLYLERRRLQGALDLAALAAARDLANAESAARSSLASNGVKAPKSLTVSLGRYSADITLAPDRRLTLGASPANAVRLEMKADKPLFFGNRIVGADTAIIGVQSTAANTRFAGFWIGTRLASLNGGVANAVLSALTGASLSLSVMDYNALAALQVQMPDLLGAVAQRANLKAGTYDDVLSMSPSLRDFSMALADAASASGAARSALSAMSASHPGKTVDLRQFASLGSFGKMPIGTPLGLSVSASALDVLTTAVGIANGSNQVSVDLTAQAPGLLKLVLDLSIGERPQNSPWLAIGIEGATVRTAQTRIRLSAAVVAPAGLGTLSLPFAADVAAGAATLTTATCGPNPRTTASAALNVTPSLAEIWIGQPASISDWNAMTGPPTVGSAQILSTPLVTVAGSAHIAATNLRPVSVPFSASEIAGGAIKTVRTVDFVQSALASLVDDLSLTVKTLGIAVSLNTTLASSILAALRPATSVIDDSLASVLDIAGVGLGESDVSIRGIRCDGSALVN